MRSLGSKDPYWWLLPVVLMGVSAAIVVGTLTSFSVYFTPLVVAATGFLIAAMLQRWMPAILVTAIAFIPIYWVPAPGVLKVAITPMVAAGLLLLPIAVVRRYRSRLGWIDGIFAVFVVLTAMSYYANYPRPGLLTFQLLLTLVLPWLAFRLFLTSDLILRRVTAALLGAAAVLAVIGIRQHSTGRNPFVTWRTPGYLAEIWTKDVTRFDAVRASASLGQPLIFGTFLAAVMLVALPVVLAAGSRKRRLAGIALELLFLVGLLATSSRGPVLMLATGVLLYIAGMKKRRAWTLVVTSTAIVVGYLATPLGSAIRQLLESVNVGDDAANVDYRVTLFNLLLDPDRFSLLGQRGSSLYTVGAGTNLTSIDSHFVLVYLQSGALTLVAFVALLVPILKQALTHPDPVRRAWAVATAATFQGLLSVALLLQQGDIFWIGVAAAAASAASGRPAETATERPHARPAALAARP